MIQNSKTVKDVLIELGYSPVKVGENYQMAAIYRNGDNKKALCVNCKTGIFYDFVSGVGGSLNDLAKLTGGKIDLSEISFETVCEKIKSPTIYNKDCLTNFIPDYEYWNKRGVSDETLRLFRNGVCFDGKQKERSVFPIINPDGRLVGFSGRLLIKDNKKAKWKHDGQKQYFVYPVFLNEKYIVETKQIVLVESIGDVLALWEAGIKNTLCIFGLHLSPSIINYLVKVNPDTIFVSTNNEESGRGNNAAEKIRDKLKLIFDEKKLRIALPPKKDFGVSSRKEILDFSEKHQIIRK